MAEETREISFAEAESMLIGLARDFRKYMYLAEVMKQAREAKAATEEFAAKKSMLETDISELEHTKAEIMQKAEEEGYARGLAKEQETLAPLQNKIAALTHAFADTERTHNELLQKHAEQIRVMKEEQEVQEAGAAQRRAALTHEIASKQADYEQLTEALKHLREQLAHMQSVHEAEQRRLAESRKEAENQLSKTRQTLNKIKAQVTASLGEE